MTPYELELSKLGKTVEAAASADIERFKTAIAAASEASIIAVGSGGSFTVASLLCSLHEAFTGRVSRAVTPLELICNPTLASTSPIFIVSAEGKNPDILEALHRARQHSSRTVHVITNREHSPLMDQVIDLNDVTPHVFALTEKDGYLATNSLVFDAAVVARAYGELDRQPVEIHRQADEIVLGGLSLEEWIRSSASFAKETARRGSLIIVFSPNLRPIAEDLESKLSEAALLFSQLADFRSFAHGRHLWLTERSKDASLLVLTEPAVERLWTDMCPQIPLEVPTFCMQLPAAKPKDLISGLIAGMHLVSEIANAANRNIAKPTISPLGRSLYYANLQSLIPPPFEDALRGEISKYEALGAHWPSSRNSGKIRRALEDTELAFQAQKFRSIVFDYDGTLCNSNDNDRPPSPQIIDHVKRLLEAGVVIGVASGRGGSMADHLERVFDQTHWSKIWLGLYNGGWIGKLGDLPPETERLSEFLIHAKRIITNLQSFGVPISVIKATAPYQISIRFEGGVNTETMWFVIVDAFKQAGLETSTIVRSN
ncbi:HAD hydrolase family protein, partial [Rhodopseudomonas sp. B29]|uniref:HAD hydrolase family protein n=1 Tax=Rhodopseudomonas sp. B29 TaxID=95607 RepID=UPI0011D2AB71